ncbi:MAG: O-antigen ligase family protein [Bacteroidia bacterium]|nr:O-antigen ligase family protein [Bacteroidia bacterium]
MTYSENIDYGLKKLETKLGLLVIPLLFSTIKSLNDSEKITTLKKNYLIGSIIHILICYSIASYRFFYELYCRKNGIHLEEYPYTNYFFTSYLSFFLHYGYCAMYINVAIMFVYSMFFHKNIPLFLFFVIAIVLSVFVMMLGSKAGIAAMFIIHFSYIIYFIVQKKQINPRTLIYLLIFIMTISLLLVFMPNTKERVSIITDLIIHKKADSISTESTQLRYYAWKASMDLIKKEPWKGYGTGDINDILINTYREKNYVGALKKEINSHNQFIQTFLSIGVLGVIMLFSFFIWMFYIGIKFKNISIIVFSIITFTSYLFESYLETQAGVFFTTIFTLFFFRNAILKQN